MIWFDHFSKTYKTRCWNKLCLQYTALAYLLAAVVAIFVLSCTVSEKLTTRSSRPVAKEWNRFVDVCWLARMGTTNSKSWPQKLVSLHNNMLEVYDHVAYNRYMYLNAYLTKLTWWLWNIIILTARDQTSLMCLSLCLWDKDAIIVYTIIMIKCKRTEVSESRQEYMYMQFIQSPT